MVTPRELENALNPLEYQAYAGTDIQAAMYLPLLSRRVPIKSKPSQNFKIFGTLQTISVSSSRSISPVRVLGRSNPVKILRGSRVYAGTMVFASLLTDPFSNIYDVALEESYLDAESSIISDQLPPFSIIISAANEHGGVSMQAIHGITLVNMGSTYSVDDMYTEIQYTYVATDMTQFSSSTISSQRNSRQVPAGASSSISTLIGEELTQIYSVPVLGRRGPSAAPDGFDSAEYYYNEYRFPGYNDYGDTYN